MVKKIASSVEYAEKDGWNDLKLIFEFDLPSARVSEKDALRMRLSVESVMGIWAEKMGEDTVCRLPRASFADRGRRMGDRRRIR